MAEKDNTRASRLTDWIILVFVLMVMVLLIVDLGTNVMSTMERDRVPLSGKEFESPGVKSVIPSIDHNHGQAELGVVNGRCQKLLSRFLLCSRDESCHT